MNFGLDQLPNIVPIPTLAILVIGLTTIWLAGLLGAALFSRSASTRNLILFPMVIGSLVAPIAFVFSTATGIVFELPVLNLAASEVPLVRRIENGNPQPILFPRTSSPTSVISENVTTGLSFDAQPELDPPPNLRAVNRSIAPPRSPEPNSATSLWETKAAFAAALASLWATGVLVGLLRIASALFRINRICSRSKHLSFSRFLTLIPTVCERVGISPKTAVRVTREIQSPVVVGVLQPKILIPLRMLKKIDEDQFAQLLTHEAAHVAARDPLIRLIQHLGISIWWWHPLIYVLDREFEVAREELCDNVVLQDCDATQYSRTLLALGKQLEMNRPLVAATSIFGTGWKLEHRIRGLLDPGRKTMTRSNRFTLGLLVAAIVSAVMLLGATKLVARNLHPQPQREDARTQALNENQLKDEEREEANVRYEHSLKTILQRLEIAHSNLKDAGMGDLAERTKDKMTAIHTQLAALAHAGDTVEPDIIRVDSSTRQIELLEGMNRTLVFYNAAGHFTVERPELVQLQPVDSYLAILTAKSPGVAKIGVRRVGRPPQYIKVYVGAQEPAPQHSKNGTRSEEKIQTQILDSIQQLKNDVRTLRGEMDELNERDRNGPSRGGPPLDQTSAVRSIDDWDGYDLSGTVVRVNRDLLLLSSQTENKMNAGDMLSIRRESAFLGKAQVVNVKHQDNLAIAKFFPASKTDVVGPKVGDTFIGPVE